MKSAFPGHFANDPDDLKALWEDSLIVVDANVLLSLYRYSDNTRNEFLDVFGKLKERLWIPHQVAKEYLKNRINVISDQAKSYEDAIKNIEALRKGLESSKQHPFISGELLKDTFECFDRVIAELKQSKEQYDNKINNDDIKNIVGDIFDGKVGVGYSDERLEQAITEGKVRYDNNVPPGFKDIKKSGGASFEDRLAPYGDYICWLQILDKSTSDKCNIIFVTGDLKDDWWLRPNGRTVGPLPELIEEFVRKTSQRFYMYMPDRFLQRAGDYLKQAVSQEAMKEARDVQLEGVEFTPESLRDLKTFFIQSWKNYDANKVNEFIERDAPAKRSILHRHFGRQQLPESLRVDISNWKRELQALVAESDCRLVDGPTEAFVEMTDQELRSKIESLRSQIYSATLLLKYYDADNDEGIDG